MGTSYSRRKKIDWLASAIQSFFAKNPKGAISKKKLLFEFVLTQESSLRTGVEILNIVAARDKLNIEGDNITK